MKIIKRLLIGIAIVLSLLVVWGILVEPRLVDIKEETAQIPNLPTAWEGKRVALIGDLQVGMWLDNTDTIARAVERIIAARPEAVLIAGDFVYNPEAKEEGETEREEFREFLDEMRESFGLIRPLAEAGIPTFAVLGNHDYGMMNRDSRKNETLARHVTESLAGMGVRVLHNEAAPLAVSNTQSSNTNNNEANRSASLFIVGIGSHFAGDDDTAKALANVPTDAARLVLMHNPKSFARLPPATAPLALAGHTHGGQIRLPFTPEWSWLTFVKDGEVHADGWITDYGQAGNRLYVNRGIGFSYVPIRINCQPEVTIFTLRRAGQELDVKKMET